MSLIRLESLKSITKLRDLRRRKEKAKVIDFGPPYFLNKNLMTPVQPLQTAIITGNVEYFLIRHVNFIFIIYVLLFIYL